jgi:hypothetical protein
MEVAFFAYFIPSLMGFIMGVLGSVLWSLGIARAYRRLAYRVQDIEDRLLSVKGKNAARARWDEDLWTKELAKQTAAGTVGAKRYDNDPIEVDRGPVR